MTDAPPPDPALPPAPEAAAPPEFRRAPQAVHPDRPGHRAADHRDRRADHQHRHQPEHDERARPRAGPCRPSPAQNVGPVRPVPGLGPGRRRGQRHAGRAALLRELVPELPSGAAAAGGRRAGAGQGGRCAGQGPGHRCGQLEGLGRRRQVVHPERRRDLPRGLRPRRRLSLSGLFYFRGDPYAVFVEGDGTIDKIVARRRADALVVHRRRARPAAQSQQRRRRPAVYRRSVIPI